MARFRLRFLLQELELVGPVVMLGRSSDCQITLDDPLVSRVHAQLTITDSSVHVRDLGSRNGVRINDVRISGDAELKDRDRLRLGTQDLVFLVVGVGRERAPSATGSLAHCPECGRPYPRQALACPHCGAREVGSDTEPVTGVELVDAPSWTFRLIGEVLERALAAGRAPEAERMLERAARDIEARMQAGRRLGSEQLREAAGYALRLAKLKLHHEWACWALRLHRVEGCLPDAETLVLIESLDAVSFREASRELAALLRDPAIALKRTSHEHSQHIERLLRRAV